MGKIASEAELEYEYEGDMPEERIEKEMPEGMDKSKKKKKGFMYKLGGGISSGMTRGYGMIKEYQEKAPERKEKRIKKMKGKIEMYRLREQEEGLKMKIRKHKQKERGSISLTGQMPSFSPTGKVMAGGGLPRVPQLGGGMGQPSMGFGSPFGGMPPKKAMKKKPMIKQKPKRKRR